MTVSSITDPSIAGDEAVMLARKTDCPVVVDPNRASAVRLLLGEHDCDLVLSDDGLQHYALGRDVEIAVIDSEKGLGNGLCLPAGPLREPPDRLDGIDFVVINGGGEFHLSRDYLRMVLEPGELVNVIDDQLKTEQLPDETVHAVAGIGNPDRFFDSLRALGYDLIEHKFNDHHRFTLPDLRFGDGRPVIMTEKDAVKCRLLSLARIHENFWYLPVEVGIESCFLNALLDKIGMSHIENNKAVDYPMKIEASGN